MIYDQVQSFQINVCANHYVDIEITECRMLYSESIAGRGVARLISSLAQQGQLTDLVDQVFDCYIRVYQFFNFYW